MSEIVNRCARAMFESFQETQDKHLRRDKWEESLGQQPYYREAARAVIAALREPSPAMIEAADDICPIARGTESHAMAGGKNPEDYWRAMIDEALR